MDAYYAHSAHISWEVKSTIQAEEFPGIVDELNPYKQTRSSFWFKTIEKIVDKRTFRVYTLRITKDPLIEGFDCV